MKITFWGAAQEVTGSKHLLKIANQQLLLDAGFFQGHRQEAEAKNRNLPIKGSEIQAIILSHAHLDHCGAIPTLYKSGFRGKIYATPATCDVARIMLEDSADIQVADADYINSYKPSSEWIEPIYTSTEVREVVNLFAPVPYDQEFTPLPNVRAQFIEAGHILGSAQIYLEVAADGQKKKLGFTGDLGRKGLPILKDPAWFGELDYFICESTYGHRVQESLSEMEAIIQEVILQAAEKKGKIVVPAFALGRTQSLIYILHKLTDEGHIPRLPIFIDSPMATELTEVFLKHKDNFDRELRDFFTDEKDPFAFRNLYFTQSVQESKELNKRPGPFIVISTAGMCEVGRIRHHLKNSVENKDNTVMITGFMARNTLGRRLAEKDRQIKIFDRMYNLRARVEVINAFSAHAGQTELLAHIQSVKGLQKLFLVHGEPEAQAVLTQKVKLARPEIEVVSPTFGQTFDL